MNSSKNLPKFALSEWEYSLRLIRLARLAIGVPRPPMLTPRRRAFPLAVKPESSRAAGTLLMIWLVSRAVRYSRPDSRFFNRVSTASIRARFPEKMENATKVSRSIRSASNRPHRSSISTASITTKSMMGQSSSRTTVNRHTANSAR